MPVVLVVEDDPIIRQTTEYALRRAGFDTLASADGACALDLARENSPDLVLLDVMLPGLDGYDFLHGLRAFDSDVPVIMVTALDAERDKVRGLDAGADDYVTKPYSTEELLARVRANLRRTRERDILRRDEVIEVGDLLIEPSEFRASVDGRPAGLRPKEFQLLVEFASHPGSLLTRHELARRVWGYEHLPSSRTIDVHIRRLRQALASLSRYEYIHTSHGLGYRFEPVVRSSPPSPEDGLPTEGSTRDRRR